jgi:hypothetical protein
MTKVGILVECGRDGLEVHICHRLCQLLGEYFRTQLQPDIVPMDNKQRLLEECGTATRLLFNDGCERVVILWDERPPWPKMNEPLCWHHERERILRELQQAGVAHRPVFLVCIEREFESWLLFDERLLSKVLSTAAHPVRIPNQRRPDQMPNPKGTMTTLFRKYGGKIYVDTAYARRFATCLSDVNRLKKCPTFRRFAEKLTGYAF